MMIDLIRAKIELTPEQVKEIITDHLRRLGCAVDGVEMTAEGGARADGTLVPTLPSPFRFPSPPPGVRPLTTSDKASGDIFCLPDYRRPCAKCGTPDPLGWPHNAPLADGWAFVLGKGPFCPECKMIAASSSRLIG